MNLKTSKEYKRKMLILLNEKKKNQLSHELRKGTTYLNKMDFTTDSENHDVEEMATPFHTPQFQAVIMYVFENAIKIILTWKQHHYQNSVILHR